ncbi:hypothetical protein HYH02_004537 [Chlamydomonas schloesseri]|uniref:Uncharacterized protein n=1 Tax=Chlamydomonas schloesseri TaxID=2026947 RepID=A0A836B8W2_9CHLO|nr:hypothetical protein HYH02_004537 [Chlamydomonas schloesseri]|eukprot:KAG2450699.1 hypothetical protein HYH02_004537 [Chlamydomonas schloesseri]
MVCPMRFVLVAISAVLAITAVVLSNRSSEGALKLSDSSKAQAAQEPRTARTSWKDGFYFVRDAFTGKYIYTQLVRYRGGARAA